MSAAYKQNFFFLNLVSYYSFFFGLVYSNSMFQICEMIDRKVLKGRNDTFTLVRAVLLGKTVYG